MKNQIKNNLALLQRPVLFLASFGLLFASASGIVEAAAVGGQVQYRSLTMSDNGVSGGTITTGVGSGTNVSYRVSFTAATSYTLKGVVVDFCAGGVTGTPFIGDATCANPTGFSVGTTPVVDTTAYVDSTGTHTGLSGTWTPSTPNSGQTFEMTNSAGTAVTAGSTYTFAINGVTNPAGPAGTFYGRLLTYTSDTGSIASYDHGTPGTYQDYGGFALSTANIVQVTAKVQESLTFCVSGNDSNTGAPVPPLANSVEPSDCLHTTAPAIILGHGTNATLDTSAVDTNKIWTIASTNALHGVQIRMHNSNACGGLSTDNGTTCPIPGAAAGAGIPGAIVAGTAAFGMHCNDGTGGTSATNNIGCDPNYNDGTATDYGMDFTTTGDNVTTTYGDVVAKSTAPVNAVENEYDFAATASNTTPAGIYTANLAMVATGTF